MNRECARFARSIIYRGMLKYLGGVEVAIGGGVATLHTDSTTVKLQVRAMGGYLHFRINVNHKWLHFIFNSTNNYCPNTV